MNILRKIAFGIGAVTLIGILAAIATPRAAHAVANLLVTVTNTSSNPVPTLGSAPPAAQALRRGPSVCEFSPFNNVASCDALGVFAVPANAVAVVEYVSGWCDAPAGSITTVDLDLGGDSLVVLPGPSVSEGGGLARTPFGQVVKGYFYGGPYGDHLDFHVTANANITGGCLVNLQGYVVQQ